jgi:hypothetical protein
VIQRVYSIEADTPPAERPIPMWPNERVMCVSDNQSRVALP